VVLSRQASQLRCPEALAGFLDTVAVRLARKAYQARRRRQRIESNAQPPEPIDPRPHPLDAASGRELLALLDEEIARLPDAYRLPVLLCLLQGRTMEEAARQLGWGVGSLRGRLTRGRERLRRRLARCGLDLCLAAPLLAAALSAEDPRSRGGGVPGELASWSDAVGTLGIDTALKSALRNCPKGSRSMSRLAFEALTTPLSLPAFFHHRANPRSERQFAGRCLILAW
jgi:RNA polymerase sigma factor (sigma-70 family)